MKRIMRFAKTVFTLMTISARVMIACLGHINYAQALAHGVKRFNQHNPRGPRIHHAEKRSKEDGTTKVR
jgi:hypothetical protein